MGGEGIGSLVLGKHVLFAVGVGIVYRFVTCSQRI